MSGNQQLATLLPASAIAKLIDEALQDESGRTRYLSEDVVGMAEMRQKLGADDFMEQMQKMFFGE